MVQVKTTKRYQDSRKLKELGYEIAMIFVNTDLETAINRDQNVQEHSCAKEVTGMWKDVQKNIGKFQKLFGNMMVIVDNSDGADYESAQ